MTDHSTPDVQLGILNLQNSVDVGFARVEGQLALVIQRADQTDRRLTAHDDEIAELTDRVGTVERSAVTRSDMETRQASSARTITIVVSIVALIISAGMSIGIAVLT